MLGSKRFGFLSSSQVALVRPQFDTSLTGNSQTYSGDGYSVTGSSSGLAAAALTTGTTSGKYLIEIYYDSLPNLSSVTLGWIDFSQKSTFTRDPTGTARVGWEEANNYQTRIWPDYNAALSSLTTGDTLSIGIDISTGEVKAWRNGGTVLSGTISVTPLSNMQSNGATLGFMTWDNNKYTLVDPNSYSYPNLYPGATLGWV